MNNIKSKCDSELISRFYDGELEKEEYTRIKVHIDSCSECRESLHELETISGRIRDHFSGSMLKSQLSDVEDDFMNEILTRKTSRIRWFMDLLISKKALVPATAFVTILLVFAVFFRTPAPSGPSAIVTSLSGDISSVIIMETPDTRQTILWFNEPELLERRKI